MKRLQLMRWHRWLGWVIGVPVLLWTVSGLVMVARPIETVRGDHLKRASEALGTFDAVAPSLDGRPTQTLTLVQQADRPVWLIDYADGGKRRADGRTGALLPGVSASEASALARDSFAGEAALESVQRYSTEDSPLDLRRGRPSWQAHFADGTNVYVDAETGAILATRTRWWRVFDFMWGLHIMDLQTREDTSHPILIGSAVLAILITILGFMLLPLRRAKGAKRARRG